MSNLPYRSECKCGCHRTPGMIHFRPCCQPDPRMTPTNDAPVTVEQCDREAAANLVVPHGCWPGFPADFRSGRADNNQLTQAFARHRLSALASALAGDAPSDGTCRQCGSAPRDPVSALCATCTDEAPAGDGCLRYVRETRDHNKMRAEERQQVGEGSRDEKLIVAILDRILEASGVPIAPSENRP